MSGIAHAKSPEEINVYSRLIIAEFRNYLHRHDASYCCEIRQSPQIIKISSGLVHVACFHSTIRRLRHHYAVYSAPTASTRSSHLRIFP